MIDIYIYAAAFFLGVVEVILYIALLKAHERIAILEIDVIKHRASPHKLPPTHLARVDRIEQRVTTLSRELLEKQDYRLNPFNSVMLSRRIDRLERGIKFSSLPRIDYNLAKDGAKLLDKYEKIKKQKGKQHGRKH